jgi:hypothetical protein
MPDSKITALASTGTGTDPANDPLVIVDVSDTSMAATGTTKKVTLNNLLACSPTATLASATITGDLTVDTNVLKVDSANNRVGIGTASPVTTFQVQDATLTGASQIREQLIKANSNTVNNSLGSLIGLTFNTSALAYTAGSLERTSGVYGINLDNAAFGRRMGLVFYTSEQDAAATEKFRIDNSGIFTWSNVGGVAGTAMTLNSTGLGVGVTPSAWNSNYKAIDVGENGTIAGRAGSSNTVDIASNGFRNTSGDWVYKLATSNTACRYQIDGSTGSHIWYTGSAGTAGNTITGFSSALMTLDASGNLIWSPASSPPSLATNGQLTVNATSNTNLRFSYRGSDGVTRVANLTLA